jgi:hypothetical protein
LSRSYRGEAGRSGPSAGLTNSSKQLHHYDAVDNVRAHVPWYERGKLSLRRDQGGCNVWH